MTFLSNPYHKETKKEKSKMNYEKEICEVKVILSVFSYLLMVLLFFLFFIFFWGVGAESKRLGPNEP
jgi:flagellar biogenesis protein FliO